MSRVPKKVYLIFDTLDGPHLFRSEKEAKKVMKKWRIEAKDNSYDSYWEMSDIFEFNKGRNCHE